MELSRFFYYESWDDITKMLTFMAQLFVLLYPIYFVDKYYFSEESPPSSPKKIESESDIYINNAKKVFFDIFEKPSFHATYNSNVSSLFYKPEELENELLIDGNEIEKRWKTNILIEDTPDGNIVMYYDAYKQAFAYTCDKQLSFKIITAVAIKYVIEFRCIDFFVDTTILPADYKSPLTIAAEEHEKRELQKKKEKKEKMGINFEGAPFIKQKRKIFENVAKKEKKEKDRTTQELVYKNTFQYKGRLCTVPFLQDYVDKIEKSEYGIPVNLSDIEDNAKSNESSPNTVQQMLEKKDVFTVSEKEEVEVEVEVESQETSLWTPIIKPEPIKPANTYGFKSLFSQSVPDTYAEFKRQRDLEKKQV